MELDPSLDCLRFLRRLRDRRWMYAAVSEKAIDTADNSPGCERPFLGLRNRLGFDQEELTTKRSRNHRSPRVNALVPQRHLDRN